MTPPPRSGGRWAAYLDRERVAASQAELLDFVRGHPECRSRVLAPGQLRFLLLLQHRVAEDTCDFHRPTEERRHNDKFEGVLSEDGVNSQLVKDSHRSDWKVDGSPFSMQHEDSPAPDADPKVRRQQILDFQRGLVTALETCVLGFAGRRGLSAPGTRRLLQAVTTQMSQCGLANLDRSSKAAGYFVGGLGLEQRTAYSLSTAETEGFGEVLRLSLCCLKTGFVHFQTAEGLAAMASGDGSEGDGSPTPCAPSSYLYQYATLQFVPGGRENADERVECTVLDALDEVHIDPPRVDGFQPL
uniref:Uncharacterized protein n=1 Tax=Alexandrium catenella TaxID=2925 RepID=A0A7S1S4Q9_ALECA